MERMTRLELATSTLARWRSTRWATSANWCLRPESNQRHADFQSAALPTELQRQANKKWRPGTGSNRRPLAWQASVLTNWTTGPFWWEQQGSNLWPSACKADALPAELCSHIDCSVCLAATCILYQKKPCLSMLFLIFFKIFPTKDGYQTFSSKESLPTNKFWFPDRLGKKSEIMLIKSLSIRINAMTASNPICILSTDNSSFSTIFIIIYQFNDLVNTMLTNS